MSRLSLAKEFNKLLKTIEVNTANQAKIIEYNPDDVTSFTVEIRPTGGLYAFESSYPSCGPSVTCKSEIFHPNIENSGSICINLLDEWTEAFGLEDLIKGLIFLFYEPNLESPLSSYFHSGMSQEDFVKYVQMFLRGENFEIDNVLTEFSPNPGYKAYLEQQQLKKSDEPAGNASGVENKETIDKQSMSPQLQSITHNSAVAISDPAPSCENSSSETTCFIKEDDESADPYPQLMTGMFVDSILFEEPSSVDEETTDLLVTEETAASLNARLMSLYSKYSHSPPVNYLRRLVVCSSRMYLYSLNDPFIH